MGLLLLFIVYTVAKFLPSNEIECGRTESPASIVLFITSFVTCACDAGDNGTVDVVVLDTPHTIHLGKYLVRLGCAEAWYFKLLRKQ